MTIKNRCAFFVYLLACFLGAGFETLNAKMTSTEPDPRLAEVFFGLNSGGATFESEDGLAWLKFIQPSGSKDMSCLVKIADKESGDVCEYFVDGVKTQLNTLSEIKLGKEKSLIFSLTEGSVKIQIKGCVCLHCDKEIELFPTVGSDRSAVRNCFERYTIATEANNGALALVLAAKSDMDYGTQLAGLVRSGSKAELLKLPTLALIGILELRGKSTPEELKTMDGKTVLKYLINNGLLLIPTGDLLDLGVITISGDTAKAPMLANHKALSSSFEFVREGEDWKIEFETVIQSKVLEDAYLTEVAISGKSREQFIDERVKSQLGSDYSADKIWSVGN